jgi:alpha-tubulin suppressor-like RCC1 family protein
VGSTTSSGKVAMPTPLHLGSAINPVTQVAAGGDQSCALMADLTAYCWGDNARGQLGNGTVGVASATPMLVKFAAPGPKPRQLAVGAHHTCAAMDDDSARCWGDNSKSQLAQPASVTGSALPVPALKAPGTGLPYVESVAVGGDTTCAVRLEISKLPISCWGANDSGQAGQPLSVAVVPYATPMSL